jgi:exodeoxyribonuclease VII small subunit
LFIVPQPNGKPVFTPSLSTTMGEISLYEHPLELALVASKKKSDLVPDDLPQDFEAAMAQLEAIVAQMERGDMSLEASLGAYQRGVALTRICQDRLARAEQKVKVLSDELLKPFELDVDPENGVAS